MAQQFEVQALGLNGIPYRIEIYNEGYGGTTVTQLDGDQQFIRFEGGQRERVGIEPIWGKEVRINVRTNEDLSPLFGLEDRDAEARVFRTDTSSLVWKGFILTDFFQDEPLTDLPGVELRAVDGLTTLEGDGFDALSGVSDSDIGEDGSFISYTDLFTGILSTLYDSPLDVEFAVEWYPDAGGQLSPSDNPLRYSGARPDVYYDSEDGEWFDQESALEDALKSQGLEVRQAVIGGELTWLVAQPTALSSGSVKTWRYAPDGTEDTSSPFSRDFSLDLSTADTNRPTREFERRSESVSVTHNHTPIENIVGDDGYEEIGKGNASGWQIDNAATSYIDASILNHDNADASSVGTPDPTPNSLQQDTYVLEIRGSSQNNAVEYPISQDLGDISGIPPETALKFSHQLWHEPFEQQPSNGDQPHLYAELEVGGFYLKEFEAGVRQSVKGGSGTLPVQSLDRAIPNGTKLPLYNRTDSPPDQIPRAFITLSERADKGDTVLVGDISRDVNSKWSVAYLGFTNTAYDFALWRWTKNPNSWGRVEARAFAKDPSGQPLSGNATLRIGGAALYGETNAGNVVDRPAFVDDVTVQLTQQGNELTETTKEGAVSENGKSRDLSVLLSSGPTSENSRRVKGVGPSSSYQATDWGIGAGGGSLSLAGLQARERLRYLREHLERQQLTVYARDKSPVVTGEEIVQFDGKTWRIAEFSSDPASGEIGLTLIQHADAGTTDLSIATVRDTEDGGTSGGGTAAAVGGGGGVSTWDALSGKPTILTPPGFSAGNFPSAEQLASADITDALVLGNSVLRVNPNFTPDELQVKAGRSVIAGPREDDFDSTDFDQEDFSTDSQPALEVDESFRFNWTQRHIWERGTGEDAHIIRNTTYGDELSLGVDPQDRFRLQLYENSKDRPRSFVQADPRNLDVTYTGYRKYVPGFTGQGIKLTDNAERKPDFLEVSHGSFRGTLRVREFIVSQTTVEAGPHAVSPGGGKVAEFQSSSHTSVSNTFSNTTQQEWEFENSDGESDRHGLAAGDRLLAQRYNPDSQTVIAQIRAVVDEVVNPHVVRVTVNSDFTVPKTGQDTEGYSVFVVGSSDSGRDSLIFDNPYGPKREILDGISDFTDWDNRASRLRFMHGNLDGRYDYSTETYGMAAGDPSGEHITADDSKGLRLRSDTDTLAQVSGTALTLGKNGAIQFDPTQSPEAKIDGTLELSSSGRVTNAADEYVIDSGGIRLLSVNDNSAGNAISFWENPVNKTTYRGSVYASTNALFLNGNQDVRLITGGGNLDLIDGTGVQFIDFPIIEFFNAGRLTAKIDPTDGAAALQLENRDDGNLEEIWVANDRSGNPQLFINGTQKT
ncbi:hypothetical protein GGP77_001679 [Salinibacter ruber]|uniref:hypothetical protein n=1 Tax=Salinibacter ruber TaxID=146919 RepID=UPI002167233B|nr:hypothetical protein [Salinibacter ruber]MCS3667450.1 hypothetical protein [Salinibacter ruber]